MSRRCRDIRGDVGIAPYARLPSVHPFFSCHSEERSDVGIRFPISLPPAASFLSAAKEKRKRNAAKNYVFGFPLRAFTQHLSRWCSPRERCAVEISPKCCIVSASLSAAAFAPKCRVVRFYIWCVGAGFYAVERSGTSALGVPRPLFHHRAPLRTSTNGKNTFQPAAKGRHLPLPLRGKGAI